MSKQILTAKILCYISLLGIVIINNPKNDKITTTIANLNLGINLLKLLNIIRS
jgi:hypothetical protein